MRTSDLPFNISILNPDGNTLSRMRPVRVLDIYDGITNNFHEDGLFSVSTFGKVGDEERSKRFSYIDMGTKILHPVIYKEVVRLKSLYRGIMSGKRFAIWNEKEKDFEPSNELEGQTGYSFFISKWDKLKFSKTASAKRDLKIQLVEKFRTQSLVQNLVVIPAGLRDLEIDENGRSSEDEINGMYRKVLSISNSIANTANYTNDPTQDTARWSLQLAFLEIYETLRAMIEGKKGFIQAKWSSRKIVNGSRNVISSMSYAAKSSTDVTMPDITDTTVGLFQFIKGILPITVSRIRNHPIGQSFLGTEGNVQLINPKTLSLENVKISNKSKDQWGSVEGLQKTVQHFTNVDLRHNPIMVEGYYLGLVYDDGENVKLFNDINSMPEGLDLKNVRPVTWAEFFYLLTYDKAEEVCGFVTRYPIAGLGSVYPTNIYLKTTVTGQVRNVLNDLWEKDSSLPAAKEFPINGEVFFRSMSPHLSYIANLGADFDGDTMSLTIVYTKQGVAELKEFLGSKKAFIDPRGGFLQSMSDTVEWAILNMTA